MTARINRALQWIIIANLTVATILAIAGDMKHALLGIIGAGCFGLALLASEHGDA